MEGVNLEAFSPYAQMTVVEGEVGRDDMSFFQVNTESLAMTGFSSSQDTIIGFKCTLQVLDV